MRHQLVDEVVIFVEEGCEDCVKVEGIGAARMGLQDGGQRDALVLRQRLFALGRLAADGFDVFAIVPAEEIAHAVALPPGLRLRTIEAELLLRKELWLSSGPPD